MNRRYTDLPSLYALQCFEAVGRFSSCTVAAKEELFVTQGAVSRQIATLEETLGVALFHRVARRMELTEIGRTYWSAVQSSLDDLEAATKRLAAVGTSVVTLSVLPSFAMRWLMGRLPEFQQQSPEVDLRIMVANRKVDLEREGVDLAIRYGLGSWPGLHSELFSREVLVPVCSPAYAARRPKLSDPTKLESRVLLHNTARPHAWFAWARALKCEAPFFKQGTGFRHFYLTIEAALNDLGVALVPSFLVARELEQRRLVNPFPKHTQLGTLPLSKEAYFLVFSARTAKSVAFNLVREWLLKTRTSSAGMLDASEVIWKNSGDGLA